MRVTVLGAGSWGTTVAALVSPRHPTTLWARDPETAREIQERRTNSGYLAGFELPERLRATSDIVEATAEADLLIVGVPTVGFRQVLTAAKETVRPWIPVVSLAKGQ